MPTVHVSEFVFQGTCVCALRSNMFDGREPRTVCSFNPVLSFPSAKLPDIQLSQFLERLQAESSVTTRQMEEYRLFKYLQTELGL